LQNARETGSLLSMQQCINSIFNSTEYPLYLVPIPIIQQVCCTERIPQEITAYFIIEMAGRYYSIHELPVDHFVLMHQNVAVQHQLSLSRQYFLR
jgi:hypothetical protein